MREKSLTLAELARAKGFTAPELQRFGVRERNGLVEIPYRNADGSEFRVQCRNEIDDGKGFFWGPGDGTIAYGLDRPVPWGSTLYIVEGSSDCWALWTAGKAALGLPGASLTGCLASLNFSEVAMIAVIQEPGAAGILFPQRIAKTLYGAGFEGSIFSLRFGRFKDARDAFQADRKRFELVLAAAWDERKEIRFLKTEPKAGTARLKLVSANSIPIRRTEWEEPHRIPCGKLTLLEGDGDLGKTSFMLGFLAAKTRGEHFFPIDEADRHDYPPTKADVLIVATEDDRSVLTARLVAANADLERIHFINGRELVDSRGNVEEDSTFLLPRDIGALEEAVRETLARVLYIDALHSHVRVEGDPKNPQDVRRTYQVIVDSMNRTNTTFLAVRHWGKGNGRAIDRGLGSSEIGHMARAILTFARYDERCVVAQSKKNLSKAMPAVAYRPPNYQYS